MAKLKHTLSPVVSDTNSAPGLQHAHRVDFIAHAQPVEDRQIARQQGFADVEARMRVLLQQHDIPAGLGQQGRGGRTRGAAADHQHVAVRGVVHVRDSLANSMPGTIQAPWHDRKGSHG